jgi:hypothetical protein
LEVFGRVKRGELRVVAASELIGLSERQTRRLWCRFQEKGAAGLVHGLRGRCSNRRLPQELVDRIIKRHQERYADFGPTLACEKLLEDGMSLSPNTLTALLKARQLWQRRRRRNKHRSRRERRASFGMMVQMDGSHHDWFEGRCGKCVLMVIIDDATNQTYARLYLAETTLAALDVFERWARKYGLPWSVYVDRHGIYRDEEHPEKPTQFGRAMKQLGVELILAHSAQAKGRVERRNALFQDRLVKELRLRKISDMVQANAFLESRFLPELNRRYALKARDQGDLHRRPGPEVILGDILCVQEHRVVGRDWCVRWQNRWLQIEAEHAALNLPGRKVLVRQHRDGRLNVEHAQQKLACHELVCRPVPVKGKPVVVNNRSSKPAAGHPWRGQGSRVWAIAGGGPAASAAPQRPAHPRQSPRQT